MNYTLKAITSALFIMLGVLPAYSEENPFLAKDDSWIRLSGTIVTTDHESFELDFGEGIVTVEMDDWDWYDEAAPLISGDAVTVNGYVDDDLYETTSIEASSVYVEDLNTYFYASGADEEDITVDPIHTAVHIESDLQLTGEVTDIHGREFTIDTGQREIQVDTSSMLYNPLDDKGYQKIREGDIVQVNGELDLDLFERKEIMADVITTLVDEDKPQES